MYHSFWEILVTILFFLHTLSNVWGVHWITNVSWSGDKVICVKVVCLNEIFETLYGCAT